MTRVFYFLISLFPKDIIGFICKKMPYFNFIIETKNTQNPITFNHWYNKNINRHQVEAYWPVHMSSMVINPKNVDCGIDTSPGYMPGCYIQGVGKIYIGDYTQIGPSVSIISANHEVLDNRGHIKSKVYIGRYCWLGVNSVILPGVELGDFTIVAAGSIVTKPFKEGYCVIAGNPARVIKNLNQKDCVHYHIEKKSRYNGFIPNEKYSMFKSKNLNV